MQILAFQGLYGDLVGRCVCGFGRGGSLGIIGDGQVECRDIGCVVGINLLELIALELEANRYGAFRGLKLYFVARRVLRHKGHVVEHGVLLCVQRLGSLNRGGRLDGRFDCGAVGGVFAILAGSPNGRVELGGGVGRGILGSSGLGRGFGGLGVGGFSFGCGGFGCGRGTGRLVQGIHVGVVTICTRLGSLLGDGRHLEVGVIGDCVGLVEGRYHLKIVILEYILALGGRKCLCVDDGAVFDGLGGQRVGAACVELGGLAVNREGHAARRQRVALVRCNGKVDALICRQLKGIGRFCVRLAVDGEGDVL